MINRSRGSVPSIPHCSSSRAWSRTRAIPLDGGDIGNLPRLRMAAFGLALLATAGASGAMVLTGWPRANVSAAAEAPIAEMVAAPSAAASTESSLAAQLTRATLMALHDANRTGNYAVLRGLAAPPFQETNSAADLERIFAGQREAGIDLSVAAVEEPQWSQPPGIGDDGMLRLKGFYDTPYQLLRFALMYAPMLRAQMPSVQMLHDWRLMEISVIAEPKGRVISGRPRIGNEAQPMATR